MVKKGIIGKGLPVLMAALIATMAFPFVAFAADVSPATVTYDGANYSGFDDSSANSVTTEVSTEIASKFTVVIPKKVSLVKNDAGNYGASYVVAVKDADIAPSDSVDISVSNTVTVNETKSTGKSVTFNQSASVPEGSSAGTVTNDGTTILASAKGDVNFSYQLAPAALTAGVWSGTATFNVALNSTP